MTRNPSDSEALAGLGDVARAQGDTAGAIAAYKRALAVNPSYLPALLGLADTQWASGDRGGAPCGLQGHRRSLPRGDVPGVREAARRGGRCGPHGDDRRVRPPRAAPRRRPRRRDGSPEAHLDTTASDARCRSRRSASRCSRRCAGVRGAPAQRRRRARRRTRSPRAAPAIAVLDLSDGVPEQPPPGLLGLSAKGASFDDARPRDRARSSAARRRCAASSCASATARIGLARAKEIGAMLAVARARRCPSGATPTTGERHAVPRGARLQARLARAGRQRRRHRPRRAERLLPQAARRGARPRRRLPPGRQVQGRRGAVHARRPEPRGARVAGVDARRHAGRVARGHRATARKPRRRPAPEDGPYAARDAKALGLVDDVGYFDEAREALEKEAGAVRAEVRFGAGASGERRAVATCCAPSPAIRSGAAPVALIAADGRHLDGGRRRPARRAAAASSSGGWCARSRASSTTTTSRRSSCASTRPAAAPSRAICSGTSSWRIRAQEAARRQRRRHGGERRLLPGLGGRGGLRRRRRASSAPSASSAGRSPADQALERIGVHAETVPGQDGRPRTRRRAPAYESLLTPWDDATRERVLETMTGIYEPLSLARRRGTGHPRRAGGRVGRGAHLRRAARARSAGLVDEIGGLREAIARARSLAGLPADARVDVAGEPSGLLRALGG